MWIPATITALTQNAHTMDGWDMAISLPTDIPIVEDGDNCSFVAYTSWRRTIFYRCSTQPDTIWKALKALAEGLDIQATARVFEVEPDTVQGWLNQAAGHMEAVSRYMLFDLHLTQVQVDELWALLGLRQEKNTRNSRWVWSAIDPVSKLFLAFVVGDRSLDTALLLTHAVVGVLASGCVPLFASDQWSVYAIALLAHFGHWVEMPRRHKRGRPPKPRWLPLPALQGSRRW